jgi:hypothetical protein
MSVLFPVLTPWDGFGGAMILLKHKESQYLSIGINILVHNALALLVNGEELEESSVFLKIDNSLHKLEKKEGEKVVSLEVNFSDANHGSAFLVSEKGFKTQIKFGTGVVLACLNHWPIWVPHDLLWTPEDDYIADLEKELIEKRERAESEVTMKMAFVS